MRFQRGLSLAIVCALSLAGCLAGGEPEAATADLLAMPLDWHVRALANGDDHDHMDASHHVGLSTTNFRLVGYDPLATDHMGVSAGGYFCGDLRASEGRTLAVVHSFTSDVAFVLVDVTDPARPTKIGEFVMEQTHVWDVAMTPDQKHVLLATSPYGANDERLLPAAPRAWFQDACDGTRRPLAGPEAALPYASGVVLVDITTPTEPAVLDYRPLPLLGGHSVVVSELAGEPIVLVTMSSAAFTSYYAFFGLLDTPLGARLESHAIVLPDPAAQLAQRDALAGNHDGVLQVHPVTQAPLAYLADGQLGVTILDIRDPKLPRLVSRWDDAASIANREAEHFAHSVLPIDGTWDGRHYTFVSEECAGRPSESPSCLVYVLDTTDPAAPTLAGAWTIPIDVGSWEYPGFSPHYMAIVDRTLFVAHWHAGLWAFDVSTPEAIAHLTPIGVYVPDRAVGYDRDGGLFDGFNMAPTVADVLALGEHVVIFDGTSGVYVLAFDPTQPAPPPPAWPLGGVA